MPQRAWVTAKNIEFYINLKMNLRHNVIPAIDFWLERKAERYQKEYIPSLWLL